MRIGNYLQCKEAVLLLEIYHGVRLLGEEENTFCANAMSHAFLRNRHSVFVKTYGFAAGVRQLHKILPI